MPRFKISFDEPDHGWIGWDLKCDEEVVLTCVASHIYDSFDQLVTALGAMLDPREERFVVWMEEPAELEMRFVSRDGTIFLEINDFSNSLRPLGKPSADWAASGTYDEICLPFWRALRSLEGRYSPEELAKRWKGYFPHRELALLTEQLGKG